jgi:hypothetical protein
MGRQQLPRGITKVEVLDRRTGKKVPRWRVTVNIGRGDERHQVRRSFGTERAARDYLDEVRGKIQSGTYVRAAKRPVKTAVDEWLGSKHKLKPSTRRGYEHDSDTYRAAALAAIERMRLLHAKCCCSACYRRKICAGCNEPWPCPTLAALNGDTDA